MKPTYVYFIKERIGIHAPIKIGIARNISRRFESLQTGNPRKLELFAKIGPFSAAQAFHVEQTLHRKFKKFRIHGEWFSGVIIKHMSKIKEPVEYEYQDWELVSARSK